MKDIFFKESHKVFSKEIHDVLLIVDREGHIVMCNGATSEMFGYEVEELINKKTDMLFARRRPDPRYNHQLHSIIEKGGFQIDLATGVQRNGEFVPLEIISGSLSGSSASVLLIRDISQHSWAEDSIRMIGEETAKSDEKYRALMDLVSEAIILINTEWKLIDANKAAEELTGYVRDELLEMNIAQIHPKGDFENIFSLFKETVQKAAGTLETAQVLKKDGSTVSVRISSTVINHAGKKVVQQVFHRIIRPIAGQSGQDNAADLQALFESSQDLIWSTDRALCLRTVNPTFRKLIYLTYGIELREGMNMLESFPADLRLTAARLFNGAMRGERIFIEHIFTFARTSVTLEILCSPTRSASRDITGAAFFGRDVTDLKGDDEGIKASLKEKEVLLKEVYHRVKNNLQLASSLLNFQGEYIKDKEALEMFRESQNRIKSMALVHEKLYESKDLARVDFADYVRNLVNNLMWSYGSDMRAIRLKVNVPEVFLHPKAAVPCGLIINELVSNAVKHAFPSQPSEPAAEIDIDFHSDNEDHYVLSVSDNGVGFPQGIDFRSTASLGLQLVVMLTEQLNGTVELDKNYDTGTRFIIRFGSSKA